MSRTPENYKRKALEIDPAAHSKSHPVAGKMQWLIFNRAGEVIGYSDPRYEGNSRMAWMRAYYALDADRTLSERSSK